MSKKILRAILRAILGGILIFCMAFLPSCNRDISEADRISTAQKRYSAYEYPAPDGYRINTSFTPEYDPDTDSFLVYATTSEETEDENGVVSVRYSGGFFVVGSDGSVTEHETLSVPEDISNVSSGCFTDEAVYFMTSRADTSSGKPERVLYRLDRNNGELTSADIFNEYLDPYLGISEPCLDGDGNIYLWQSGYERVVSLSPDLMYRFSISTGGKIRSMAQGSDGSVWILAGGVGSYEAMQVDTESGKVGNSYSMPEYGDTLLSTASDSEYIFYVLDMNNIYGASFDDNGKFTLEEAFGLVNSGIIVNSYYTAAGQNASSTSLPIAVYSGGSFLFMQLTDSGQIPVLYRPYNSDEVGEEYSITIAHTVALAGDDLNRIVMFRREHPNVEIITKDYTVYNDENDDNGADERLAFDLVNGFCTPDIIIGSADGAAMEQVTEKNLYTDLTPYLEADEYVNFDNLFGCVVRMFDDGNGGMWGITPRFRATTIVTTREILGDYGKDGYWTLEEMLDFMSSLSDSEDTEELPYMMSDTSLTVKGFGHFVDLENAVANFDTDLFCRYITYLSSLPKNYTELLKSSKYAQMTTAEQLAARINGNIALEPASISYPMHALELCSLFMTDEYVPIGYATDGTSGTITKPIWSLAITSFTEDPDICFELIKAYFEEYESTLTPIANPFSDAGISSMKPLYEEALRKYKDTDNIFYYDGTYKITERTTDTPLTEDSLEKPGRIIDYTDDDIEKVMKLLDEAGYPLTERTPDGIEDIVNEELSAFFAGMGSAEDCAAKIQSRVEIWLAEHE